MKISVVIIFFMIFVFGLIIPFQTYAENRALLIGVGKYKLPKNDLPGIDHDIRMMKHVVRLMGFQDHQVKTLQDSQATKKAVESALNDWLRQGVTKNDRVLIYISSHGSRIPDRDGDEADQIDEVLLPYDMSLTGTGLKNVLIDDQLGEMLSRIPAKEVIVMIDACHSGTATRIAGTDIFPKFFWYKGIPETQTHKNIGVQEDDLSANANYIGLSASRDDESAIATSMGSLFTRGIFYAVDSAEKSGQEITVRQLQIKAEEYIRKNISSQTRIHRPQISGNLKLAEIDLMKLPVSSFQPEGILSSLDMIVSRAANSLNVRVNQKTFKKGDLLIITCEIPEDGYINIVNAAPGDIQPTVLFPNKSHPDNHVRKGTVITIPDSKDRFKLRAGEPFGENPIFVFLTIENINAYTDGVGKLDDIFKTISEKTVKRFEVEELQSFWATKIHSVIEP